MVKSNKFEFEFLINHGNYIIRDHRVHGLGIIPGVTFIDMIYRALVAEGFDTKQVKLLKILFKQPIAVTNEYDKNIRIVFNEVGENVWNIEIESRKVKGNQVLVEEWDENCECEVRTNEKIDENILGAIDIEQLKTSAKNIFDMDYAYNKARGVDIQHYEFMKALGEVHVGDCYILAKLHLGQLANEYINDFYFHPAYLDGSTIALNAIDDMDLASDKPAIPMVIDGFYAQMGLKQSCYVYIEKESISRINDIVYYSIGFYGEDGSFVAKIDRLAIKEIRSKDAIVNLSHIFNLENNVSNTEAKIETAIGTDYPDESDDVKEVIKNSLCKMVAGMLNKRIEEVSLNAGFYDQGLDSSSLLKIVKNIEKKLGQSLYPTLLFEYSNISDLAEYLYQNYGHSYNKDKSKIIKVKSVARKDINEKESYDTQNGIAIIGISGRYPMANNLEEFWDNLKEGKDCITEIPKERWDYTKNYDSDKDAEGKSYSKWGGFINDIDKFDPLFFNISPKEAEEMDPQERLFLQTVWETLENAGYTRANLANSKIGVFVGVMWTQYQLLGVDICKTDVVPTSFLSSIANRISYYCNFQGPSLAVDTMCSSSLTAIHLACESIVKGECEEAIAGGVNLIIHPHKYRYLSKQRFLSSDGRCRSFGEGGDGYVPGEGVGALLLKPLDRAISNGDNIYGIIKGSSLNHGGKTSGYTVPNPQSQYALIEDVLHKTHIEPRTISYMEAHGTGTSLGDPIEITGLKRVFEEFTDDKQFCAIGSAKSNIGHLESAAGIAGITKVLLQMKYKQLVPSIHSDKLNPNIDFEDSPFYVQHETTNWQQLEIDGKKLPRRAGISSFGAGGSNAHMVLEEPPSPPASLPQLGRKVIIILSAKNRGRLDEYIKKLIAYLENIPEKVGIADIAYTFQVGREAMEERLATVATSVEEFRDNLAKGENIYRGNVMESKGKTLLEEHALKELINDRKLEKLCELWVSGVDADWSLLYGAEKPRRIPLPTYPFEKERCWVEQKEINISNIKKIHILINENISTLNEEKFVSRFEGTENYFTDHKIAQTRMLPGAVQIEMAMACGKFAGERKIGKIKDIFWVYPIKAENAKEVYTSIYPTREGAEYEVWTDIGVHSKGVVIYYEDVEKKREIINIEGIKERCLTVKEKEECYENFRVMGLNYGETFQTIETMYVGEREALAVIKLPEKSRSSFDEFVMHPSIIDGALQSIMGLVKGTDTKTLVPFSIGEIEIVGDVVQECYAYATVSRESQDAFNIVVADESGNVFVRINDFTVKAIQNNSSVDKNVEKVAEKKKRKEQRHISSNIIYIGKTMVQKELPKQNLHKDKTVIVFDADDAIYNKIAEKGNITIIMIRKGTEFSKIDNFSYKINPKNQEDYEKLIDDLLQNNVDMSRIIHGWCLKREEELENRLNSGIYSLFMLSQELMKHKVKGKISLVCLHNGIPEYAGLYGFAKTIRQEKPNYAYKVVKMMDIGIDVILDELEDFEDVEVCYRESKRYVGKLEEVTHPYRSNKAVLKENGAYIITGGLGGLGFIFSKYLARNYKARLVLSGRSDWDSEKKDKIEEIERLGAEVNYVKADICKKEDAQSVIDITKMNYGRIDGVIHAAGLLNDAYVIKKKKEEIEKVIAPKIYGLINLIELLKEEGLDFFMMFSSVAGILGNAGQCDYSYANSVMDNFAEDIDKSGIYGKVISINWPLWKEGGMRVDKESEKMLFEMFGMKVLETKIGIQVFEDALTVDGVQIGIIEGDIEKVRRVLAIEKATEFEEMVEEADSSTKNCSMQIIDRDEVLAKLQETLVKMVSDILRCKDVQIYRNMSEFGFDSISFAQFGKDINKKYGLDIVPAIFFEYTSILEFSEYLMNSYWDKILEYYGASSPNVAITKSSKEIGTREHKARKSRFGNTAIVDDIAIIGMAGVMPQSPDLEVFWKNLVNGVDMITPIPEDRNINTNIQFYGGFIPNVDKFDPLFFGISPMEAELMDPQQRIFMEVVWKTIEDAGYKPSSLAGSKTGLFVGVGTNDYNDTMIETGTEVQAQTSTGIARSVLANRISYLLDIRGPSEPIDTACSSSLVAIHRAVQAMHEGDCDMAIVGGVNVMLTATLFESFSKAGMLSPDGRCKTFDAAANGYVRGEGAGAILIKPLDRAMHDGDHIYAVIKGTAVNHGGHANSLTAPNPNAQADLLIDAWRKSGIDTSKVSYLEAHGTGTSLGDPIEINGIKKAFGKLGMPAKCAIGAVKSNIGHLETAAGIAGIIKVVMMMKYGKIPGNLNYTEMNPQIQLDGTRFYIADKTMDWEGPRIAGISSFGFGGVNSHVVLEQHTPVRLTYDRPPDESQIIVLSAKNRDRLDEYKQEMVRYLNENNDVRLADIAYTLQLGRDSMEERLATIVSSMEELRNNLVKEENLHRGNAKENKTKALLVDGKAGEEFIRITIQENRLDKLCKLWVAGIDIDWSLIYTDGSKSEKVPLPTYPFEKRRYWIPKGNKKADCMAFKVLHPLIDSNESTLQEQRFKKTLGRDEFYLREHVVMDKMILPGAAYIEMARAAGELSNRNNSQVHSIKLVMWAKPIVVKDEQDAYINLYSQGKDIVDFEITTSSNGKETINASGKIVYGRKMDDYCTSNLDIEGIMARSIEEIGRREVYDIFDGIGLEYGESFRNIDSIIKTETEVLAHIKLRGDAKKNDGQFVLNPALIDAAFQATVGFMDKNSTATFVPFMMDEIKILGNTAELCYVYVSKTQDKDKFNIKIAGELGIVAIEIRGFTMSQFGTNTMEFQPKAALTLDKDDLLGRIQKDLQKEASEILKIPEENIDTSIDMGDYGFDSITFNKFSNVLSEKYNITGLMPSVFFEYSSIETFAGYLNSEFKQDIVVYYKKDTLITADDIEQKPIKPIYRNFTQRSHRRGEFCNEDIAIVGMAGVMPQSADLQAFWDNLINSVDMITPIPEDRNITTRKQYFGGFMPNIDKFDSLFFGISPMEAELMDPQQRIFMQVVWKTLEDAGYSSTYLSGSKTGLFVGVASSDYNELLKENGIEVQAQTSTGIAHSILANRISFLLGIHGPSEPIDTACSSSLVAIHRAVQSIKDGDCEMAIAGGVNVMLTETLFESFSKAGMLSIDGRCKTFDKAANGYVRGEGAGAILLKPLDRAVEDGDHIYAVVKGTAVNHGGHANSLTAPNANAQAELIMEAWRKSGIDTTKVSYM